MKGTWETDEKGGYYHYDSKGALHSVNDMPAAIDKIGCKAWYKRGRYHRSTGPAVIHADDTADYYLEGIRYSKEQWESMLNPTKKLTVELEEVKSPIKAVDELYMYAVTTELETEHPKKIKAEFKRILTEAELKMKAKIEGYKAICPGCQNPLKYTFGYQHLTCMFDVNCKYHGTLYTAPKQVRARLKEFKTGWWKTQLVKIFGIKAVGVDYEGDRITFTNMYRYRGKTYLFKSETKEISR